LCGLTASAYVDGNMPTFITLDEWNASTLNKLSLLVVA